jgi:hypothetical protein
VVVNHRRRDVGMPRHRLGFLDRGAVPDGISDGRVSQTVNLRRFESRCAPRTAERRSFVSPNTFRVTPWGLTTQHICTPSTILKLTWEF